jgi:hypothetical protein
MILTVARILIILGIVLLVTGGGIYLLARLGLPLGRLPGDFRFQSDGFTCFLPLGTSIILSLFLSLIFTLVYRLINK